MTSYGRTSRGDNRVAAIEVLVKSMQPEEFLSSSNIGTARNLDLLTKIYDFTKISEHFDNPLGLQSSILKTSRSKLRKYRATVSKTEAPLFSLITEGFDLNQIWEEVELQNRSLYESVVTSTSKLLAYQEKVIDFASLDSNSENGDTVKVAGDFPNLKTPETHEAKGDSEVSDYLQSNKSYYRTTKRSAVRRQYPTSLVDDGFFSLAQMTVHIERVEAEMERAERMKSPVTSEVEDEASGEGINLLQDIFETEDDKDEYVEYFYQDFFDPPQDLSYLHCDSNDRDELSKRAVDDNDNQLHSFDSRESGNFRLAVANDVNELSGCVVTETDENMDGGSSCNTKLRTRSSETLSSFEKRLQKIEENIQKIESGALEPKSWQLLGEATAECRPKNALLEEHLFYDHLIRPAPDFTVETTLKLEDVIKQRVKNAAWEDVQRKARPIEDPREYKKGLVLSAEQSKTSLIEIYEQEYVNMKKSDEKEMISEEPEEHARIAKDMQCLFSKLDAMSHYQYTPKPVSAEVKILTNVSAISMDDVAPINVSHTILLAPQEITDPINGPFKSKEERTETDKKRERRKKKHKQHLKRLMLEDKACKKGLGLRNVKLVDRIIKPNKSANNYDLKQQYTKELKSSKAFFAKLQETLNTRIKNVTNRKEKAFIETETSKISAKKFKL